MNHWCKRIAISTLESWQGSIKASETAEKLLQAAENLLQLLVHEARRILESWERYSLHWQRNCCRLPRSDIQYGHKAISHRC